MSLFLAIIWQEVIRSLIRNSLIPSWGISLNLHALKLLKFYILKFLNTLIKRYNINFIIKGEKKFEEVVNEVIEIFKSKFLNFKNSISKMD